MPLFGGKKKEEALVPSKPKISKYKDYSVPGPTSCLALTNLQGKDAIVASALKARGLVAMDVDGEKLWSFDTGATVYSLAIANLGDTRVVVAGSGGKVFAISENGTELWRYSFPATHKAATKFAGFILEKEKRYGYNDVYHLVAGRLDGEDVIVAIAGLEYSFEGMQIISLQGKEICSLKKAVLGCLFDLSPRGDAILAALRAVLSAYKEVSVISKDGEIKNKLKLDIDMAPKDRSNVGGFKDKYRGKLVAGKLNGVDAVVLGSPETRSVGAASLDGIKLWKYEASPKGEVNAGINDIAIGSINDQSVVIVGTFDHCVHLISGDGHRIDAWRYPSNVNNVAYGKIHGRDAIAVGLYNGEIFTYTMERT
ncbi:MAG: PQQ-binding-like beta-propeller repeat protein [Candidatus Bathyarchaeia archaeon]